MRSDNPQAGTTFPQPTRPTLGERAADLGLPVFACGGDKRPIVKQGFKGATQEHPKILRMFAKTGAVLIGVPTGEASGHVIVDVDCHGVVSGRPWLDANKAALPKTRTHRTGGGGLHLVFAYPVGRDIRNSAGRIAPGIDVRGNGGYACWPPSPGYEIVDDTPPAEMPEWLIKACCRPDPGPLPAPGPSRPPRSDDGSRYGLAALKNACDRICAAPFGQQEETLNKETFSIGSYVAGGEIAGDVALADLLSAGRAMPSQAGRDPWHPTHVEDKVRKAFADGKRTPRQAPPRTNGTASTGNGHLGNGHLQDPGYLAAIEADLRSDDCGQANPPPPREQANANEIPDELELTEHGVAVEFARQHKDALRYCHHAGAWYVWTGTHWHENETKLAFSWARALIARLNRTAAFRTKATTGKAAFAAAVERFGQADEQFAVTSEIWDRDTFLLGTPGGTVDLRNCELRPARPADYITRLTAVAPAKAPHCPLWLQFLEEITGGDRELVRFLRQWCGYCLTGDTREHALLFGFGPGGNGKSVFLNTVANIMGSYALTAGMETFSASSQDRHTTELARLRGARMVSASETEEGRAWAETRVKQITGGDRITARFMRQDDFTFLPQFKLTIVGNNKPVLKNVDDAARRRFNVVPFLHKPAVPDKLLETNLEAEWPAILRWAIEGCLDWQMNGLIRPSVVNEATDDYFQAQDYFSRWLAECCDLIPTMSTKPSHLWHSFQQWCQANGEPMADNRKLRPMLEKTPGVRYAGVKGVQWVRGIVLRPDASRPEVGG